MNFTRTNALAALPMAVLVLAACGASDPPADPNAAPSSAAEAVPPPVESADPAEPAAADAYANETGDEIDPESLSENGTVDIKQYQAAFIASGTLGKGTLSYGGQQVPFRIGGLGFGGFGVAAIDAHGTVYNLTDLQDFTGAYGNARLGITAADKGKGKLWLKNTNGVVIKLASSMEGLALTGGVDGIIIEWESEVQEAGREMKEGTKKAWEGVKKPFE